MDIASLITYFKFGYHGDTIDLIYLFLIGRFFVFPILVIIYNKLKGGVN